MTSNSGIATGEPELPRWYHAQAAAFTNSKSLFAMRKLSHLEHVISGCHSYVSALTKEEGGGGWDLNRDIAWLLEMNESIK